MTRPPRFTFVLVLCLAACGSGSLPASPPDSGPGKPPKDADETTTVDTSVTPDAPVTAVTGDAAPPSICGGSGQTCCAGNACNGGGCCQAGVCIAQGAMCTPLDVRCMAGACGTCGGVGQPCCPGQFCTATGASCIRNSCVRCGGAGEPCCPPPPGSPVISSGICTRSDLVCDPDSAYCKTCGAPGAACCTGNTCGGGACCFGGSCVAPGQTCGQDSSLAGTCTGGSCTGCGNLNQPCCGSGYTATCGAGQTCQDSRCIKCGGAGETCCPASATTPACSPGNACGPDYTCLECGGPGEACCPGHQCGAGGCCFTDRCVAPGIKCTYEGKTYGTCNETSCGCGSVGQPCCPGAVANGLPQWTCNDPNASCGEPAGTANVRTCSMCGVVGGPCCSDKTCREKGTSCMAQPPEGFRCRKCGGDGEPCCTQRGVPDPFCDTGLAVREDNVAHTCTCGS